MKARKETLEKLFGRRVFQWLDPRGQAVRHEDKWSPGIADISWAIGGREGWIELKVQPGFVDPGLKWQYLLREYQLPWLCRREQHGAGNVRVLYTYCTRESEGPEYVAFKPSWLKKHEDRGCTLRDLTRVGAGNHFTSPDFDAMMLWIVR